MKKKRLAAVAVALVIILSCGFCVFAVPALGIGDVISIIDSVDLGLYPSYNETGWNELSLDDRRTVLNNAISSLGGSSYLDDDFLNSSQAYDYYCYLIRGGNSIDFLTAPATTMFGELMLERAGQADFGLGFYKGGSHSGGKFGYGTVADTLNDEFLDYLQSNELPRSDEVRLVSGSDGRYITWRLVTNPDYEYTSYSMTINGVRYRCIPYGFYLYLHDAEGTVVDFRKYCYALPDSDLPSSMGSIGTYREGYEEPYLDITYRLSDNHLVINAHANYVNDIKPVDTRKTLKCPWILTDIEQSDPAIEDPSIPVIGIDDNGNTIDLNINSDGVIYEGNTYNYNPDNSVTINGDTYYITVDPSKVDDDYYNQFLQQVINNYYNYYTSSPTEFDDTDIIKSLKSIFDSLERFRNDFYSYIRQIYNTVADGFNSMRSSASKIVTKLDTIIKQLKDINKELGELTEEQEQENLLSWLDLIEKFKKKVGWASLSQSVTNISSAFFGERVFTISQSGDISVDIVTKNSCQSSTMPSLYFEFMGVQYDLFSCVGSLGSEIETIKSFISLFLWVGFILSVYRSIPSIIGGVSAFEEQQNKRGA